MNASSRVLVWLLLLFFCLALSQAQYPKRPFCNQPKKPGPCKAFIVSWFYNPRAGHCKAFVFGGCQENKNNFPSCNECMKTCSRKGYWKWRELCTELTRQANKKYGLGGRIPK